MFNPTFSRRGLLRFGAQAGVAAGLSTTLGGLQRALAASDTTGYKALICVFLYGGNDSYNWLVPRAQSDYDLYAQVRQNLALARDQLLPLTPLNTGGREYGLHPSCTALQSLFQAGKAAFIVNTGSLIQPTTAAQFQNESVPLPPQLFSHSDQQSQMMTAVPQATAAYGWGGRVADLLDSEGYNQRLAINISLNGNNIFQSGSRTVFYNLSTDGAPELNLYRDSYYREGQRRDLFLRLLAQAQASPNRLRKEFGATVQRSYQQAEFINTAVEAAPALNAEFPQTYLGAQLRMVTRMIQARSALGVQRQVFFVGVGGWDFHDNQLNDQAERLGELSAGLGALQQALAEIGAESQVTTFTASDFGRTLTSNGDGSDHGWGGHSLVLGGSVLGRRVYGRYPDLSLDGPEDGGSGRIIPSTSTDQVAATLASWFGVANSDLDLVFPNLRNFSQRNLGFMA